MKYNFDEIIDRRGSNCYKWDKNETTDILPMWIADMDFKVAPAIENALRKRLEHPIFGYTFEDNDTYKSIISWIKRRYNWKVKKEWISFSPGVVPTLSLSILALTKPGDRVLIMSPVYPPFYRCIRDNGRIISDCPLEKSSDEKYYIDFEKLESQIDNRCKAIMICNPHNPVGRVWGLDELKKIAEIVEKHDLYVISDEIHSDFVYSGRRHVPIASISETIRERTITAFSPSKTFNIAGLCQSYVIIPNKNIFNSFQDMRNQIDIGSNLFGITALKSAYSEGEDWLNELILYLENNRNIALSYIEDNIPKISAGCPEGTYLIWLNCSKMGLSGDDLNSFFIKNAGIKLNSGATFSQNYVDYMRLNIGCPKQLLLQGLDRISRAVSRL